MKMELHAYIIKKLIRVESILYLVLLQNVFILVKTFEEITPVFTV